MAKCCVLINKIKSYGTLKSRHNHDLNEGFRKQYVDNADLERFGNNDVLKACTDENGNEISYDKAVKDRIKGLKQPNGKSIRKDAVLAYDVVLEFGDSEDIEAEGIDVEECEKRALEWLKETFNIAGDGKDNVISVVCHKDEASPHIHAIVTPVDERGCLCGKSFTGSAQALSRLQDSYAESLADLGIERGVKGSSAHHKPNRKYNAEKKKAAEIPKPEPNQTAEQYVQVYQESLEQMRVELKTKADKQERQMRAKLDQERNLLKKSLQNEISGVEAFYRNTENGLKQELENVKTELEKTKMSLKETEMRKNELEKEYLDFADMAEGAELYNEQQKALKHANKNNPELARQYIEIRDVMEQEYLDYLENNEAVTGEAEHQEEI